MEDDQAGDGVAEAPNPRPKPPLGVWPRRPVTIAYERPERHTYGADRRQQRAMTLMWLTQIDPVRCSPADVERARAWVLTISDEQSRPVILSITLADLRDAERHHHEGAEREAKQQHQEGDYGIKDGPAESAWRVRYHRRKARQVFLAGRQSNCTMRVFRRPVMHGDRPDRKVVARRSSRSLARRSSATSSRSPDGPPGDEPPRRWPLASRGEAEDSGTMTEGWS
jgi:hypothetical protein